MGATLSRASLREAVLTEAAFTLAVLTGADLTGARLGWTVFAGVDLSSVKGLEDVVHDGPSSVGIDTLYRSQARIPELFLQGAGVPDAFIAYARSLVEGGSPLRFYSCFLSHSTADKGFVERLYADLQTNSVRCWFAPEDLKIGERFRDRIEEAIRVYDKLLLVLSSSAVNSAWVEREVTAALEREDRTGELVLFPVRLDDAVMEATRAWAADLRRNRHIGDFTMWKDHDSYCTSLQRLLRDLKAERKRDGESSSRVS